MSLLSIYLRVSIYSATALAAVLAFAATLALTVFGRFLDLVICAENRFFRVRRPSACRLLSSEYCYSFLRGNIYLPGQFAPSNYLENSNY
jgi:hypothetical protein